MALGQEAAPLEVMWYKARGLTEGKGWKSFVFILMWKKILKPLRLSTKQFSFSRHPLSCPLYKINFKAFHSGPAQARTGWQRCVRSQLVPLPCLLLELETTPCPRSSHLPSSLCEHEKPLCVSITLSSPSPHRSPGGPRAHG